MNALLAELPAIAFGAMLVFARVGTVMMLLPGIGEAEVPAPLRLAFAVTLTALLYPALAPFLPEPPGDPARLLLVVGAEVLVGLWFGFMARFALFALVMCGQLVSLLLGFASVLTADAVVGPQGTALSRMFALLGVAVIFGTGLYAVALGALKGSYGLIPAGSGFAAADATDIAIRTLSRSIGLALQLAAPFLVAAVMVQGALGLLSRLVPQIQVYFLALPAQILAGLGLLGALIGGLLMTWRGEAPSLLVVLPGGG